MIAAAGDSFAASSLANIYLRELGSARQGRAAARTDGAFRPEPSSGVRGKSELTEEEKQEIEKLKRRDREVRQHEAAHKAAAGAHAKGAPSFEYTRGPDGKQYATGGEVSIDTSEIPNDPQATIRKMQQIRQAASAPAQPSSQDRKVAAQAAQIESQARAELAEQRRESANGDTSESPTGPHLSVNGSIAAAFSQPASRQPFIDLVV